MGRLSHCSSTSECELMTVPRRAGLFLAESQIKIKRLAEV